MHTAKTIRKKILYVFSALALLTGMIPLAIAAPVYAAGPSVTMSVVDPYTGALIPEIDATHGYNVANSRVSVLYTPGTGAGLDHWVLVNQVPSIPATFISAITDNPVIVQGVAGGETLIEAVDGNSNVLASADKKWGSITSTSFGNTGNQSVPVIWSEANKSYSASVNITDTVTGMFNVSDPVTVPPGLHAAEGAKLNWYLVDGAAPVNLTPGEAPDLKTRFGNATNYPPSHLTQFNYTGTVTGGAPVVITSGSTLNEGANTVTYTGAPGTMTIWLPYGATGTATNGTGGGAGTVSSGASLVAGNNTVTVASQTGTRHITVTLNPFSPATQQQTVSDKNGQSTIQVCATGEEAVQVIVVPEYPFDPQDIVTPEVTTVNFTTQELPEVPQVRWVGEKIVLEKNFGANYHNGDYVVGFNLDSPNTDQSGTGTLYPTTTLPGYLSGATLPQAFSDWTTVDSNGLASVVLESEYPGDYHVNAALYLYDGGQFIMENQHAFEVYYLKLESLSLENVVGKRANHDSGLWINTSPPWPQSSNPTYPLTTAPPAATYPPPAPNLPPDNSPFVASLAGSPAMNVTAETLNVSQDTLLRANVRGWFTNADPSTRPAATLQVNPNGTQPAPGNITLPAGRWVLPDDWASLAGPNWQMDRLQWDIMDSPSDMVWASSPLGTDATLGSLTPGAFNPPNYAGPTAPTPKGYNTVNGATTENVIGPFSPGIELMTPSGWNVTTFVSPDLARPNRTVVPNGTLDAWDAPMPPAKVIFQINNVSVNSAPNGNGATFPIGNSGFFKAADKTGIYYLVPSSGPLSGQMVYTNPFYAENIAAHEYIPAFVNNGGYDWDSFGSANAAYGPYDFWTIINRPTQNAPVATTDSSGHPTVAEVYSDNHGEAMVYLNGNWNLNLSLWGKNGGADVSPTATVGSTTVQAMADYPYFRADQPIMSNIVVKTWTWGGLVLGTDSFHYQDGQTQGTSTIINSTGTLGTVTPQPGNPQGTIAVSDKKLVWLWLTDRDGTNKGVKGATVNWSIDPSSVGQASWPVGGDTGAMSNFNATTSAIWLTGGFLSVDGTSTNVSNGVQVTANPLAGTSVLRSPTLAEADLFLKFYTPTGATQTVVQTAWPSTHYAATPVPAITSDEKAVMANYVVSAIELQNSAYTDVTLDVGVTAPDFQNPAYGLTGGSISRTINVNFGTAYPEDDQIRLGDANNDGVVNMGDVTSIERMILGLQPSDVNAYVNGGTSLNMGAVIKVERMILGLP